MTTEAIETEEQVHDAVPQITTGPASAVVKFDVARADIEQMKAEAAKLSINGVDDKAGELAVYQFRQAVKRQRVAVEKRAKELKAPHLTYNREVDAARDELTGPMEQIEDELLKQEKTVQQERERIAEAAEAARRQRYADRANVLIGYGFVYDPGQHAFGFKQLVWILVDDVRDLSDEDYAPTLQMAREGWEREQERLKEEKRLTDEETQRVKNELKKQRDDQIELQRQLDQQAADLRQQRDEIAATQKAVDDEKAETQRKADEAQQIKAQKKIDDDKRKADKERQARLAPDKKLLRKYLGLYTITFPQPEQPEAVEFHNRVKERVAAVIEEFRVELDAL